MDFSTAFLGTGVVAQLQARRTTAVLLIGRDRFTRAELAKVECFNFQAAANLSAVLSRELKVANTREVFDRVAPSELAIPRLGVIAFAVLGAAFEAKGVGGDAPLEAWVRRHAGAPDAAMRTISTIKHRVAKERAEERKAADQRRRGRQAKARRLRADRILAREGGHV